ncbi:MAG: hypothetical protein A3K19_05765 [Lentisphaerae bacterium RIFOXYB12_FULL_65_16]|nr:MAG: hypothetical protein A3K19_05765 [Lentisphaerae bacterium RIFOXYB12_FULL_65_16]
MFSDPAFTGRNLRCRFLWLGHREVTESMRVRPHQHPFWHADFAVKGQFMAFSGRRSFPVLAGEAVEIPPGTTHNFFHEKGCEFVAVRYEVEGITAVSGIRRISGNPFCVPFVSSLLALDATDREPSRAVREQLEYLVCAWVASCHPLGHGAGVALADETGVVGRVRQYLERQATPSVRVFEVARALDYSENHLSALFRKAKGVPLKAYLDSVRAEKAARLLRYADLTITQIAESLEFPDLYSFSRFFTRMCGESPREFRRRAHAAGKTPGAASAFDESVVSVSSVLPETLSF